MAGKMDRWAAFWPCLVSQSYRSLVWPWSIPITVAEKSFRIPRLLQQPICLSSGCTHGWSSSWRVRRLLDSGILARRSPRSSLYHPHRHHHLHHRPDHPRCLRLAGAIHRSACHQRFRRRCSLPDHVSLHCRDLPTTSARSHDRRAQHRYRTGPHDCLLGAVWNFKTFWRCSVALALGPATCARRDHRHPHVLPTGIAPLVGAAQSR